MNEIIHFYVEDYAGHLYGIIKPLDECTWKDHRGVVTNYYKGRSRIHFAIDREHCGLRNRPRCGEFEN